MVTKFSGKFAIIMFKKHRKFCRCALTHLDATPIFKKSFGYLWDTFILGRVILSQGKKVKFQWHSVLIITNVELPAGQSCFTHQSSFFAIASCSVSKVAIGHFLLSIFYEKLIALISMISFLVYGMILQNCGMKVKKTNFLSVLNLFWTSKHQANSVKFR